MKDRTFYRILTLVTVAGILSVIALVLATWLLYRDCSILSYIVNKG